MKALLLSLALAFTSHGATMPPWKEILGPSQGKMPASSTFKVAWRTNLASAMVEARQKNQPLFVTFRCLPCKREMEVWWTREGEVMSGKLVVAEGWRKTILDWRMSFAEGIGSPKPGFFPMPVIPI